MKKKFGKFFVLAAVIVFVYSYFVEPACLVTKNETIYLANWDCSLNGLNVAVVSDLHIGAKKINLEKVKKIVKMINSQNPDLIVILGDFDAVLIESSKIPHKDISAALNQLKAPCGVYAILGNHDYNPPGVVKSILKDTDIKLLVNESDYIFFNTKKIKICGVGDWWFDNVDVKKTVGKINTPTILLSHNPDAFDSAPDKTSLTLSGHTHGGEVVLPLFGPPFVPSVHGKAFAKGLIKQNNKTLYITSGIGTLSGFRLLNPPEIVLLTLMQE